MPRPKHHFPADGDLLCGCVSFGAAHRARDACARCSRRLEDLLHAVRAMSDLRGFSELVQQDKRVMRAVELAFAMRTQGDDEPFDPLRPMGAAAPVEP